MDLTVKFGVGPFTGQSSTPGDGGSIASAHREIVELAEVADDLDFDSVWLSEHHGALDGYLGALFPVLGAIAVRTTRVILGTRVALAPLYNPLRLAEDAAEVSILSGRSLILGLGAGYHKPEFEAFGVPISERGKRLEEAVERCLAEWSSMPALADSGNGTAAPPEIWLGGRAESALKRAAQRGSGYVAPLGDYADTVDLLARLDGHLPNGSAPLPIASSLMVAVSGVPGAASAERGMRQALNAYQELTGEGPDAPRNRGAVVGDVDEVATFVAEKARLRGPDRLHHVVCRLAFPGMRFDDVVHQMDILSSEVLPRVRGLL